jgi:hypothetical protein
MVSSRVRRLGRIAKGSSREPHWTRSAKGGDSTERRQTSSKRKLSNTGPAQRTASSSLAHRASLDRVLTSQNLKTHKNPGQGDCAWYALIDAGKLSAQLEFSTPTGRALKCHLLTYCATNKEQIHTDFANECKIPRLNAAARHLVPATCAIARYGLRIC